MLHTTSFSNVPTSINTEESARCYLLSSTRSHQYVLRPRESAANMLLRPCTFNMWEWYYESYLESLRCWDRVMRLSLDYAPRMQNWIVDSFSLRQASNLNCVCVDLEWYQAMQNCGWGALDTCSIQGSVSVGPLGSSYLVSCFRV
jgi:hypothetical protein